MGEGRSSATDFVTDVTDVTDIRKKEEGRRNYAFYSETRSPLAPLKKGGTRVFVKSLKTSGRTRELTQSPPS